MIESLLTDSVVYRSFRGDCADYDAETKDYTLGNVMVREVFSSDDDFVRDGCSLARRRRRRVRDDADG